MKDDFRAAIGKLAAGVTVVTMAVGDELNAMTATAVTSVSMEPPLILVCVDRDNYSHKLITEAKGFAVHVLSEEQQDLSDAFARPGAGKAEVLKGLDTQTGLSGAPIIEGCLAHIDCGIHASHAAGDHTIFVGKVLSADSVADGKKPLLYWAGAYARLGE